MDIIITEDLKWKWKDEKDYEKGIQVGGIKKEWVERIENSKDEIFNKIEKNIYPFDGSWLQLPSELNRNKCFFPTGWNYI